MIRNIRVLQFLSGNRPFSIALVTFIILRFWFSSLGIIGVTFKPLSVEPQNSYSPEIRQELESDTFQRLFLSPWYRFDVVHYLEIAKEGYKANDHNSAFPPLFSALTWLVNLIIPSLMGSAMLVSNLAAIISIYLLYILIRDQISDSSAQGVIYWLAVFPTTFLLFLPYTESLFLVTMLGCLVMVQRKKWFIAAILAGLATLTRFLGILLTVVFIWEAFTVIKQNKALVIRKNWVYPVLAGIIPSFFFLGHFAMLKFYFNADFPWEAISLGWVGQIGWPWMTFISTVREMITDPVIELQVGRLLSLIGSIFVPIALIATRKSFPIAWQIFFWLLYISTVLYANNGAFHSTFRYALPIIPMYVFLSNCLVSRVQRLIGLAVCVPLQAGLAIMFYMWIWVF